MSMRELINRYPKLATVAILIAVCSSAALAYVMTTRSSENIESLSLSYYTTDEGKTWFTDEIDKPIPFDHDGKPAYRAMIFKCGQSAPFCGYLQRLTEPAKAKVADLKSKG